MSFFSFSIIYICIWSLRINVRETPSFFHGEFSVLNQFINKDSAKLYVSAANSHEIKIRFSIEFS